MTRGATSFWAENTTYCGRLASMADCGCVTARIRSMEVNFFEWLVWQRTARLPETYERGEVVGMSKNEKTGKSVASIASKLLANPRTSKAVKSVAASALTQRPGKKR